MPGSRRRLYLSAWRGLCHEWIDDVLEYNCVDVTICSIVSDELRRLVFVHPAHERSPAAAPRVIRKIVLLDGCLLEHAGHQFAHGRHLCPYRVGNVWVVEPLALVEIRTQVRALYELAAGAEVLAID